MNMSVVTCQFCRDGFEDSMFEAKACSLRGQDQGQFSSRPWPVLFEAKATILVPRAPGQSSRTPSLQFCGTTRERWEVKLWEAASEEMSLEVTAEDGQMMVLTWRAAEDRSKFEGRRLGKLGHRRLTAMYGGQSVTLTRQYADDVEPAEFVGEVQRCCPLARYDGAAPCEVRRCCPLVRYDGAAPCWIVVLLMCFRPLEMPCRIC